MENRFNNGMTKFELAAALAYIPVHLWVLPNLLALIFGRSLNDTDLNYFCYTVAVCYMLGTELTFLRRDFDPLCDHLFYNIIQIISTYISMMVLNLLVSMVFQYVTPVTNPNNNAVVGMFGAHYGKTFAMSVFLAPIAEEIMFRGGIFGLLSRYNKVGAYIVCVLAFSLYHVWAYALADWHNLIYIVQYIPVTFLLCLIYDRTRTIWSCIFFHMIVNYIALNALDAIQKLM